MNPMQDAGPPKQLSFLHCLSTGSDCTQQFIPLDMFFYENVLFETLQYLNTYIKVLQLSFNEFHPRKCLTVKKLQKYPES